MSDEDSERPILYKIKIKNINFDQILFYIDDLSNIIKPTKKNKNKSTYILVFRPNYYPIIYSYLKYSEFRKALDILIEFVNFYGLSIDYKNIDQNYISQETSQYLNQKLIQILNHEPYSINQITLISEYLNHYSNIKIFLSPLYNYLTQIKNFYQDRLWPIENKIIVDDKNLFEYYKANYQHNRYLTRYIHGNRIFRIAFMQNKFSFLTYHLVQKYLSYIEKSQEYNDYLINSEQLSKKILEENPEINSQTNKTYKINQPPILYRGIHSKLAKNIMNLQINDNITFKGFQSQTYSYFNAEEFSNPFTDKLSDELINFKNSEDGVPDDFYYNVGMVLHLRYPDNFKFLCFNSNEGEILTYPNSRYQIKKIYFNNFVVNCDLVYLDNSAHEIEVNLFDFDMKFLTVLIYLNYYKYYHEWFSLYMYFLENIDILEQIIREKNLEIKKINFSEENYLEEFEKYVNSLSGLFEHRFHAFESNNQSGLNFTKEEEREGLKNLLNKIDIDRVEVINKYLNEHYTNYL